MSHKLKVKQEVKSCKKIDKKKNAPRVEFWPLVLHLDLRGWPCVSCEAL